MKTLIIYNDYVSNSSIKYQYRHEQITENKLNILSVRNILSTDISSKFSTQ